MGQNQHYVPKIYLKQFTKNKSGHFYAAGPKPNYLTTLASRHITQVCYFENFYSLTQESRELYGITDAEFIEEKAFDYEKLLPRIFKKLNHKNVYLTKSYYDKLIESYLSLKQRNYFYRQSMKNSDIRKLTEKELDRFRQHKEWIESESREPFDFFMSKIREKILSNKDLADDFHKQGLIETANGTNNSINRTREVIKRMNLYVLEPLNSSDYLITSDNPGFTLDGDKVYNTNFGKFDTIGFPINSKQIILFTGQSNQDQLEIHKRINFRKINSKEVKAFNYCTIFNSSKHIFCESKEYLHVLVGDFMNDHPKHN